LLLNLTTCFGTYDATLYRIVADFSRDIMPSRGTGSSTNGREIMREIGREFLPFPLTEIKSCITYVLFRIPKFRNQFLIPPELKRLLLYL
jgi:hypothetical protein